MSWKPEVRVDGAWYPNQVVFATEQEAKEYALDLFNRWTLCTSHRAVESSDPVNYIYKDHRLEDLK